MVGRPPSAAPGHRWANGKSNDGCTVINKEIRDGLRRDLLIGIARQPLRLAGRLGSILGKEISGRELKALAILAQQNRFASPPPPPPDDGPVGVFPRSNLIPERARPLVRRFLTGKHEFGIDIAGMAVADTLSRHELNLHPFDLPPLEPFVARQQDLLGDYAVAWARRTAPSGLSADANETNWLTTTPAKRYAYLASLRRSNPAGARELISTSIAGAPAAARADMVEALAVGLSVGDVPILERALTDKTASIRSVAARVLSRVKGSKAYDERLAIALGRLKINDRRVALDYPANVVADDRQKWAIAEFSGLGLDTIAASVGLSIEEIPSSAASDPILLSVFGALATEAGLFDLLAAIALVSPVPVWEALLHLRPGPLRALPRDRRQAWVDAVFTQNGTSVMLDLHPAVDLYLYLRGPLSLPAAHLFLESNTWAERQTRLAANERQMGASMEIVLLALGALMPASLRSRFRDDLHSAGDVSKHRALLLLDVLDALHPA